MSNQETKKTLTLVDRSTKQLSTTVENIQKVVADLASTAGIAASLASDIEFKQSELEALELQAANKQRELEAELKLKVKENADSVLETLLKERGLMSIKPAELYTLQGEVRTLQESNQEAIDKAVAEAVKANTAKYQAEIAQIKSAQQVEVASLKANETALRDRLQFITENVQTLQDELRAERQSRIEIARAEAQKQGVTVNTGK